MNSRKRLSAFAVLLATSSLALAACGEDEPDNDTNESTSESTESTPDAPETETETETTESTDTAPAPAPAGDLTAPGTELTFGEPATVPFTSGNDGSGTIEVSITEIVKGAAADLAPLDLGDQAKGFVPYYIQVSVTGVSGSDTLSNYSINESIEGLLPDGEEAQNISIIGTFEPCDGASFPGDFADGQTFTTCVPYLAQESSEVSAATFAPREGEYNSFDGEPVVWK